MLVWAFGQVAGCADGAVAVGVSWAPLCASCAFGGLSASCVLGCCRGFLFCCAGYTRGVSWVLFGSLCATCVRTFERQCTNQLSTPEDSDDLTFMIQKDVHLSDETLRTIHIIYRDSVPFWVTFLNQGVLTDREKSLR